VRRLGLLAAACLAAFVVPATAEAYAKSDLRVPMDDGVQLAATLYLPDGSPPASGWPAVVLLHAIGGTRASTNALAEQSFATQGYAVLAYDARGHGESGGLFSGDGPREIADLAGLHAWLAARADVDDGRIGAWGISYGGGAVLRALVQGVPFAAAEVSETWFDLYQSLLPGDLAKSGAILAFLGSVASDRTATSVDAIRGDALASRNVPVLKAFAAERSAGAALRSVHTPVLWFQGRRDFAFGLEQGIAGYRALAGPKRLYIGPFGHTPSRFPGPDLPQFLSEATAWFDRFLKGLPNGIDTRPPIELAPDPYRTSASRQSRALPATRTVTYRTSGRTTIGGGGIVTRRLGTTRTLLETFGAPIVRLTAAGTFPHVVAVLLARQPDGSELRVAEGGAQVRLKARPRALTIRLSAQATTIARGSRLTLRIGGTSGDLLYIVAPQVAARLTVTGARVTVPLLRKPVSR
jgi:predicted acyl esterase